MTKTVLYVNACVRPGSRTRKMAEHLLKRLGGAIEELDLASEQMRPLDRKQLELRDRLIALGSFDDTMFRYARQFAEADEIVIAAPYWDLSFPASLKTYIERINAIGVTFDYNENNVPYGLCRAKRVFYVTTAGGEILSDTYGFGYIQMLCERFYGIGDVRYIKAEGLDVAGADVNAILKEGYAQIDKIEL